MSGHGRVLVSETDQFWQYAREAMLLVCDAETAKDKHDLLGLAGTWTQVALQSRSRPLGDSVPRDRLKRGSLDQVRPRPSLTYIKQPQSNAPKVILGWGML
jgi:hypothetical protein